MKKVILTILMLVAVLTTMSAQDYLEKTMAPVMWVEHVDAPEESILIGFDCGEEAIIHVLVDGEEVMQGESFCEYRIQCLYMEQEFMVSAYAKAEGKLPSDTISELVVVPCRKLETPVIMINYADPDFDFEGVDYSEAYGGYYQRLCATIDYPYSDETEVTVFYRMGVCGEQYEFAWGEWTEYGGYDEEGNLQHLTYETDDPTLVVTIEAYATVNSVSESEHVFADFRPIMLIEKPWWAVYDIKKENVFYKITSDSTVSVCTRTTDQYEYAPMYDGAYSGDVIIPDTVVVFNHTYTVTGIDQNAFANSQQLVSVSMPSTISVIGSQAFLYCQGLTSLTIPSSVKTIGYRAFDGCAGLTGVIVDSDNTIYDSRDNCNAIIETASNTLIAGCNRTVIPRSVTSIGNYAFDYYINLTSIDIPNSVTSIGDFAFSFSSLTDIVIPNSVAEIGAGAFTACRGLTNVNIPESVTRIGYTAFGGCSLRSITCFAVTPPDVESIFDIYEDESYNLATLFVPMESLESYRAHEEWGRFTHIVPFIGAGPGDIDGSGSIDVDDVVDIIGMILEGSAPEYADVNGDGSIDIDDITVLINMLLNGH